MYNATTDIKSIERVGMIIVVAHTKGGVGKSTISWNIAIALKDRYNIELVDLDFQQTLTYINQYRSSKIIIRSFINQNDFKRYIGEDNKNKISIIDVGGFDSDMNRISLIVADMIITPLSDSQTEILGLMRFEQILEELGDSIKVDILLNNINPQKKKLDDLKEYIRGKNNLELFDTILRSRVDYGKALDMGLGVIEYKPSSKASEELQGLIEEIETKIKG